MAASRITRDMGHSNTIFVTSLFDMPHYVREFEPARLISIIQPELQPERPPQIARDAHLRVGVDDITEHQMARLLVEEPDIRQLIAFIEAWDPEQGALLTHCYAGVSRSTATALIAHYIKGGDAYLSATALRAAAPHAAPNRRIISIADSVLGCGGNLIDAMQRMSAPDFTIAEGALTTLQLGKPGGT